MSPSTSPSSENSSARINKAVQTATDLMYDDDSTDGLDAHCRWELGEVFKHIRISDLLSTEVLAALAIFCPVHSRVLVARLGIEDVSDRPLLSVIHCRPDD